MKIRLLSKLRNTGRNKITVHSITRTNNGFSNNITGVSYGYDEDDYKGLFGTEESMKEDACKIYFEKNIEEIRKKYAKYSRKFKIQ